MEKNSLADSKVLILLAVPVIMENLLQSMVGFVDTLFISKLGLEDVAAIGIANTILQVYFAVFLAIATAATIFVSRYFGASDYDKVRQTSSHAIVLSISIGILFGFLSILFSEQLLRMMGATKEVANLGKTYFRIVAGSSILISLMYTMSAVLRGSGDTKTPMRVGIIMNLVHIVLDYVLIFGMFYEGLGIMGAALATVFARFLAVLLLYQKIIGKKLVSRFENWYVNKDTLLGLLRVGTPAALERLFMRFGQVIYFGMIIRMGTEVYAAHTLAGNFTIFSTVIGTGLATATTTMVGQSLGSNKIEKAKKYGLLSLVLSAIIMTAVMLAVFLSSPKTAGIFTTHPTVIALIVTVLAIDVISQPATAAVSALTAVLQGGGDTKFPMYVTLFGIWAIRTLGVYFLGIVFDLGLIGVWISIAIDNYLRAIVLFYRYRTFKWIKQLEIT